MKASPRAVSGAQMDLVEFGAIPVLKYLWPDSETLNAELRRVIMAKMASSPGVVDSNEGGWHSTRDLPTWEDAAIGLLIGRVRSMVRELVALTVPDPTPGHLDGWQIEGWANVNTRGALNKSHHHAGGRTNRNLWSGIYYVDDGGLAADVRDAGVTKFEDRSGVPKEILRCPNPFERELTVVPTPGLMVCFPATLRHYVCPHPTGAARITIAFNLRHPGFVIPRYAEPDPPTFLWRNLRGPMLVARHSRWYYAYEFDGGLDGSPPGSAALRLDLRNGKGQTARADGTLQRFRHFMPWLLQATGGNLRGRRVLDIACNSGFWSLQCALLGAEEVVGFDARPELIEQARYVQSV